MPASLVSELKLIAGKNHYLDISEAIRSLLRQKYLDQNKPYKSKVMQVKKNLEGISDPAQLLALKKTIKLLEDINEIE